MSVCNQSALLADVVIRDARDDDSWDLIGLIAACWSDYPGCVLDVHGEEPWLLAPATSFSTPGGRLWVADDGRRVIASVGLAPADVAAGMRLRALYVARPARRRGLAARLVAVAEAEALRRGAAFIDLWTDTRFVAAHALYERRGYVRGPHTRALHDLSRTVEYSYRKDLMEPPAYGRA